MEKQTLDPERRIKLLKKEDEIKKQIHQLNIELEEIQNRLYRGGTRNILSWKSLIEYVSTKDEIKLHDLYIFFFDVKHNAANNAKLRQYLNRLFNAKYLERISTGLYKRIKEIPSDFKSYNK